MNNEIAKIEDQPTQAQGMLAVISRASTDPNVDIDKMERLLTMQMTMMDKQAEADFYAAMSELQSEMPAIQKAGEIKVQGTVRSRYARFEDILSTTKPLLQAHGFSVSFKSNFVDGQLEITGTLSHRAGHQESTTMRLPFDDSGAKNKVQQIGSSVSYGKRYVYCMLLNVNITEDDDDGRQADIDNTLEKQHERLLRHNDVLRDVMPSILAMTEALTEAMLAASAGNSEVQMASLSTARECWVEFSQDEQAALWVAPTKGGVFSTKQRELMQSPEFNKSK